MIEMSPLVSVIIPVYNQGDYISQAIDSVLNQTYSNFEIIVVDDGSTDDTREVVSGYNNKVRYFYQENGGVSSARNFGIKVANGQYVAFLDADDYWIRDKLSLQLQLVLEKPSVGLVFSDIICFDSNGRSQTKKHIEKNFYRGCVYRELFRRSFIPACSVVVRSECFDRVGYFDDSFTHAEDADLWLRIAKCYEIDYVDKVLAYFRVDTPGSLSKNRIAGRLVDIRYRQREMWDAKELIRPFYREARKTISNLYYQLGNLYCEHNEYKQARNGFLRAITYDLFSARSYFSFVKSLSGDSLHKKLMNGLRNSIIRVLGLHQACIENASKAAAQSIIPLIKKKRTREKDPSFTILCFHRICRYSGLFYDKNVSAEPAEFRRMVRFMKRNLSFITIKCLYEHIAEGRPLEPNSIMLTFDDGYRDNALNAFPALADHGIPATIFVPTGYIDTDTIPWEDLVAYFVNNIDSKETAINGRIYLVKSKYDKQESISLACRDLKYYDSETRSRIIAGLYQEHKLDMEKAKCLAHRFTKGYMSAAELRYWAGRGIEFGAHTLTHPALTTLDEKRMWQEISGSKSSLEAILDKQVSFFAYPYGIEGDYNSQTRTMLEKAGFDAAMTLIDGRNDLRSDTFELKRIGISQGVDFRLSCYGYTELLPAIRELLGGC